MMVTYNPAEVAFYELPIARKAYMAYNDLFFAKSAQEMCQKLLEYEPIPSLTADDYANIAQVANGGMWKIPTTVYDDAQWTRDRTLSCVAGQQITESIYYNMLNVLPPLSLPHVPRTMTYSAGFLCSEPYCCDPCGNGMLYSAFGKRGDHYYYIGLLPCRSK